MELYCEFKHSKHRKQLFRASVQLTEYYSRKIYSHIFFVRCDVNFSLNSFLHPFILSILYANTWKSFSIEKWPVIFENVSQVFSSETTFTFFKLGVRYFYLVNYTNYLEKDSKDTEIGLLTVLRNGVLLLDIWWQYKLMCPETISLCGNIKSENGGMGELARWMRVGEKKFNIRQPYLI